MPGALALAARSGFQTKCEAPEGDLVLVPLLQNWLSSALVVGLSVLKDWPTWHWFRCPSPAKPLLLFSFSDLGACVLALSGPPLFLQNLFRP